MHKLKFFYTATPVDLEPGDEMFCLVKVIVKHSGDFDIYRCAPPAELMEGELPDVPQGSKIGNKLAVAREIFPVIADRFVNWDWVKKFRESENED